MTLISLERSVASKQLSAGGCAPEGEDNGLDRAQNEHLGGESTPLRRSLFLHPAWAVSKSLGL